MQLGLSRSNYRRSNKSANSIRYNLQITFKLKLRSSPWSCCRQDAKLSVASGDQGCISRHAALSQANQGQRSPKTVSDLRTLFHIFQAPSCQPKAIQLKFSLFPTLERLSSNKRGGTQSRGVWHSDTCLGIPSSPEWDCSSDTPTLYGRWWAITPQLP